MVGYSYMPAVQMGKATLTAAGAVGTPGTLDISALSGDYSIIVEVSALSAASGVPSARVQLEDSVNAFTNVIAVEVFHFLGPITSAAPVRKTITNRDLPALRAGTGSAVLRANVVQLNGTTPSITVTAWVDRA